MPNDPPKIPKIRAPHPGEWIRVSPDPDHRSEVLLVRDDEGLFLVAEHMEQYTLKCAGENQKLDRLEPSLMFMAMNREGEIFLWAVKKPVSKQHIAYRAMAEWVRFPTLN